MTFAAEKFFTVYNRALTKKEMFTVGKSGDERALDLLAEVVLV